MPQVLQRELSYGEQLEQARRRQAAASRPANTYTFSVKVGSCHYKFYRGTKRVP